MTARDNARLKETLEYWNIIPGHEGYEASNFGRIRNRTKGNVLVPVKWGNRGHVAVKVGGGRGAAKKYVHRLVLMSFEGGGRDGQIACHKNDDKTDNRLENLYWGTYKQNYQDAIKNGKYTEQTFINFRQSTIKYAPDLVEKVRAEYTGKRGEQSALARKYDMSISNVHLIVHGMSR